MKTLLLLFLSFGTLTTFGQDYRTEENIAYVEKAGSSYQRELCLVDIYYPTSGEQRPVFVWYHGGGLTGGRKEILEFLKNKGLVVVGVGYRIAPNVKVEDIISDSAKAVSFVIKHAERYRIDRTKVFLSGHSAGSYLALMLGLYKAYLLAEVIDADGLTVAISISVHVII